MASAVAALRPTVAALGSSAVANSRVLSAEAFLALHAANDLVVEYTYNMLGVCRVSVLLEVSARTEWTGCRYPCEHLTVEAPQAAAAKLCTTAPQHALSLHTVVLLTCYLRHMSEDKQQRCN